MADLSCIFDSILISFFYLRFHPSRPIPPQVIQNSQAIGEFHRPADIQAVLEKEYIFEIGGREQDESEKGEDEVDGSEGSVLMETNAQKGLKAHIECY